LVCFADTTLPPVGGMLYQLSYYRIGPAKIKKSYTFGKTIVHYIKDSFMPLTSSIVLAAFSILGIALLIQGALLKRKGLAVVGYPTIQPFYFYSAKVSLFISWGLFMCKALLPALGYIPTPSWLQWIAIVILCIGCIFMIAGFFNLGDALKVGLPGEDTKLMTGGIYRISRNPIYLGVHLIAIASCIYFPDLANFGFAAYAIFCHHQIAIAEEVFLGRKFGSAYEDYKRRVRRYL
jgi:protein-S-isoprenylcysteine O-methyltransferase Ste14